MTPSPHNKWYKQFARGGLEAVRSDIGVELYNYCQVHDDGVVGNGGMRIANIGPQGSGKTTWALDFLPRIHSIKGVPKQVFFKNPDRQDWNLEPETIIYRGRRRDYWNAYHPKYYKLCFPMRRPRALKVFIFKDDDITFIEESSESGISNPIDNLDIYRYTTQSDLYGNLIEGGINVIYPPNNYYLSPELMKTVNEMMMKSEDDKTFYRPGDNILVKKEVFWYDLFYFLIDIDKNFDNKDDTRRKIRWITFFLDEAHEIFPNSVPKPFWYLVDDFADHALIDTRRINLTIIANIHATNLVYYKVLQRFGHFVWLSGSKPKSSYSLISRELTQHLPTGWFLIEQAGKKFGKMQFNRIPNQPYTVLAKGVT
jgi:hypothetical protein